jgi:glycosyltransferase involved in cell wall biosynthesis
VILGVNGIRLVANRSGVGRAIEAILACMSELEHPFDDIRVYTPRPLDSSVRLPAPARNVVLRARLPGGLWEQIALPWGHADRGLLFCPSYVVPLLSRCPTLLVHHGSYEGYPQQAQLFSWWTRTKARLIYPLSARRATLVSTVSHYSKRDIVRYYGIAPDKIRVVPEGVDTRLFRPILDRRLLADWRKRVLGEDAPVILYVGKPTRRRNLPNLIRAFARLKQARRLPHRLLLIGTALPGASFEPLVSELGLTREVVMVPYAGHDEIALAYNASDMLVYPSDYEGFGMPVLEAMACGRPVIALDNTAFPEFAGGVAWLLPDGRVDTLARAIEELLTDEARRERMAQQGPRRAAEYDWRIITRRYIELMVALVDAPDARARAR